MLIKHTALAGYLKKPLVGIYVLIGVDHYLLDESTQLIKKAWQIQQGDVEDKRFSIHQAADWPTLIDEANSYSLFHDASLLHVTWDKKTIDAAGKNALQNYLNAINPRCLLLIRAPLITQKQLQWLINAEHVTIVHITSLTSAAMLTWIKQKLQEANINYAPEVPALIQQYTQGNHLASAQLLEKLFLTHESQQIVTTQDVLPHLIDQCDYQLYELADACLSNNIEKSLHLIKLASENRTEATLILWLLTQEIRILIQLTTKLKNDSFASASKQLNIWSTRTRYYEQALKRLNQPHLYALLRQSQAIDECIKTGETDTAWRSIEQLILSFCSVVRA